MRPLNVNFFHYFSVCGMRYKTRPGLTYHYAHSHRDEDDSETANKQAVATPTKPIAPVDQQMVPSEGLPLPHIPMQQMPSPKPWPESNGIPRPGTNNRRPPAPVNVPAPPPPVTPAMVIPTAPAVPPVVSEPVPLVEKSDGIVKKTVNPSPYCDFCLGDSTQNKKTGLSEQLVSCADCGRSGKITLYLSC